MLLISPQSFSLFLSAPQSCSVLLTAPQWSSLLFCAALCSSVFSVVFSAAQCSSVLLHTPQCSSVLLSAPQCSSFLLSASQYCSVLLNAQCSKKCPAESKSLFCKTARCKAPAPVCSAGDKQGEMGILREEAASILRAGKKRICVLCSPKMHREGVQGAALFSGLWAQN